MFKGSPWLSTTDQIQKLFPKGTTDVPAMLITNDGEVHHDAKLIYHNRTFGNENGYAKEFCDRVMSGVYMLSNKMIKGVSPILSYNPENSILKKMTGKLLPSSFHVYAPAQFGNFIYSEIPDALTLREPMDVVVPENSFLFLGNVMNWHAGMNHLGPGLVTIFTRATFNKNTADLLYNGLSGMTFNPVTRNWVVPDRYSYLIPSWTTNTTNPISDCGFGSIYPIVSRGGSFGSAPDVYRKLSVLMTLFQIEVSLSHCGYLLFTTSPNINASSQYDPFNILHAIAKAGNQLHPILNPNQGDHSLPDAFTKRIVARKRNFGLITHYGLLNYYQSPEFKELKLTI